MEKYRLQLKLKDGQSLGYIQMDNGEPYYDYGYSEATLFDPTEILDLLKRIPFDRYDVFAEVPYTTNKGRKGKTALRNEELKTYMQNELNDKSEQFMENKIMKNEQMYDELGNAVTPEEYAKGVADGTVNEAKEVDEHEANELVLYMENTQKHYNNIMAVVKNLARKMAKGNFDKELAVKGMMYPVNDAARAYKKEFSGEGYEQYSFNPATRKAAAEELLDRYMEDIEDMAGTKNEMFDEYGKEVTPEEYAKGVADGTINEAKSLTQTTANAIVRKALTGKPRPFKFRGFEVNNVYNNGSNKISVTNDDLRINTSFDYDEWTKEFEGDDIWKQALIANDIPIKESKINETVEDETNDCMLALEDYLVNEEGVSLEDVEITGYGEDEYTTDYGDYYVFDDYDKAVAAAVEYEKQTLEEIGIDALNWNYMPYEIGHYVNRDWFQAAMEESNQFYIDDIKNEAASSDEFESRLEEEMADAGVTTEEEYLEHLNNNYADPIDWYRDNFGDGDFNQVVEEKGLVDLDAVAEGVVETDGPANALAGYDGNEVEWEFDGNYYYIYRNN